MTTSTILNDEQWKKLEPLFSVLPVRRDKKGRPWVSNQQCFEGVLWLARSGARWKDLPGDGDRGTEPASTDTKSSSYSYFLTRRFRAGLPARRGLETVSRIRLQGPIRSFTIFTPRFPPSFPASPDLSFPETRLQLP
jgi:transposase